MRHRTAWKSSSPKQVTLTALFWAFIRTIFTVRIPITLPSAGNTLAIVAHKVRRSTRLLHYKSLFAGLKLKLLTQESYIPTEGKTVFRYVLLPKRQLPISRRTLEKSSPIPEEKGAYLRELKDTEDKDVPLPYNSRLPYNLFCNAEIQ